MGNQNESLDVNGRTIEEAIEKGLAQLGLLRKEVDIEVLSPGKRGVFGLGAEAAEVRLTPRKTTTADPEPPDASSPVDSRPDEPEPPQAEEEEAEVEVEPEPKAEEKLSEEETRVIEIAQEHLRHMLDYMGIQADVTFRVGHDLSEEGEKPPLVLDIVGEDLGILIGRRNETLRAVQYMIRLMVSKEMRSWQPIVVDVESYRVRRRRSLHQMAMNMAERAVNTERQVILEAMPAYERRLVHIALKDHPEVFTKSIGSGDNRKVTIIPK